MNAETVDLSKGTQGILEFSDGMRFWCPFIGKSKDGSFSVRWEHGWYKTYSQSGESICAGVIVKKDGSEERVKGRDIVKFVPCEYDPDSDLPTSLTP